MNRHSRFRRLPLLATLATLVVALAGCSAPEPVGSLAVEPQSIPLRYPQAGALQLHWQPTASLERINGRATVFVHLVNPAGEVVRTFDHPLPESWEPGVPQSYPIDISQSAMAPPLAAGSYALTVGLYDVDWGNRWPIETQGKEVGSREYRVATVEIAADEDQGPTFRFSSGWLAAERRGDQQVPMRRRLAADAAIEIEGLQQAGTLLFALTIHDDTGQDPVVRVKNDCNGIQRRFSGAGTHSIEVQVLPGEQRRSCSVDFEPRGSLAECGDQCPAYLEQATFRPAPL
jgi:hypothetical protein